jgi:hypothetical protein
MKGYGSTREVKTSKVVNVEKNGQEEVIVQNNGSYMWRRLAGEITIILTPRDGSKNITLLKLLDNDWDKLNVSVQTLEDDIEEEMQKQLEIDKKEEEEETA